MVYAYLMKNIAELSAQVIEAHVEHLKTLDKNGSLILCGPFCDYPGGIVLFKANSREQAVSIAESDPFISSGCKSYDLRCIQVASKENNYLL